ncbi:MAG: alpha/beta hydrolase [Reyranella sp.]|uniref:alpha/beta fold hydrolase n=1 Tax=Reyranella sp. TaxID=1929291 RepID=UPI001ACD98E9|nr:alpha/beta hydrolase [Reyranella sp.]MBN9087127.1 alpha/beta hydrolase [Reyranella sp.]
MDRRSALAAAATTALVGVAAAKAESKGTASGGRPSFVETDDGASLFHLDWGTGKPVVFCHPWALTADIWEYQLTELVDHGLRCVAYDRRGHGRSSDPGRGYDYDRLADDLAAVIERLDLRDVTLAGYSMGNGEAVRYLSRHGSSRIARLVMVSTVPPQSGGNFDAFIAALKQDRPTFFTKGVTAFTGGHPAVSPAMTEWVIAQFMRSSPKAVIDCMRAISRGNFEAELRAVKVPTLVVHGDKDQVNPLERTGKKVAELIPNATLKVYEEGPHGLAVTHRDRLARDILAFARA